MPSKKKIQIHQDELDAIGLEIQPLPSLCSFVAQPHRDDHYMFIIQLAGSLTWELDFISIKLKNTCISYVVPGQVHQYIDAKNCEGWMIFVEPDLVPKQYREIFDTFLNSRQIVPIQKDDQLFTLTASLEKMLADKNAPLIAGVVSSFIHTICGLIASKILSSQNLQSGINSSKYTLANRFKQLVKKKFKECKQVKEYAALLNITPLYLNEVMNEITGFPASYWIQQEILLEARRLLYYSTLDIKEVAYELGYEDHAYFSRFFKKNAGLTASDFRNKKP